MFRNKLKFIAIFLIFLGFLAGQVRGSQDSDNFLRLYVVADAHLGHSDRGQNMLSFAKLCNRKKPDIVLDLGDTIQAGITSLYNKDTHREASLSQQEDWLAAWNQILIKNKAVALGNRDLGPESKKYGCTLSEEKWINTLGYQNRPLRGGTKLQESFIVENDHLTALIFVLCTDCASYNKLETLDWIQSEVIDFSGDWLIFASHRPDIYPDIRDVLGKNQVNTPALFLHGHNHGPDTLVRDAWGFEQGSFDFPSYLVTPLMKKGIAVKFKLYLGGDYEIFRLDLRNQEISQPTIHHQILVE
jgi:hypothetical protein